MVLADATVTAARTMALVVYILTGVFVVVFL